MPVLALYPTYAHLRGADPLLFKAVREALQYPDIQSPTGFTTLLESSGKFPAGLASRVLSVVRGKGHECQIEDHLCHTPGRGQPPSISLYPHQIEALKRLLKSQRAILHAVPRAGKTRVAAALIQCLEFLRPCVFIIERSELGMQAADELEALLEIPVRRVGGSINEHKNSDVIVAMRQTLAKNPDRFGFLKKARLVIYDECQHLQASQYTTICHHTESVERVYGLSGTPWSNSGQDLRIEGNAGPIVHRISYLDLLETRNPITGDPYLTPPMFIWQEIPRVEIPEGCEWRDAYQLAVVQNELRNNAVLDFVAYLRDEGRTCVVTVDEIKHGEILADMIGCPFTHGSEDLTKRIAVLKQLKRREIPCVVSTLYKEAVDIPSLDGLVNAAGKKSSIAFYQNLRNMTYFPGKKAAPTLEFRDQSNFVQEWGNKRYAYAINEPAFLNIHRSDYLHGKAPGPSCYTWLTPYLKYGPSAFTDWS